MQEIICPNYHRTYPQKAKSQQQSFNLPIPVHNDVQCRNNHSVSWGNKNVRTLIEIIVHSTYFFVLNFSIWMLQTSPRSSTAVSDSVLRQTIPSEQSCPNCRLYLQNHREFLRCWDQSISQSKRERRQELIYIHEVAYGVFGSWICGPEKKLTKKR